MLRTYKEWKEQGYIVKKGEHAIEVEDGTNNYLFDESQVVPIKKCEVNTNIYYRLEWAYADGTSSYTIANTEDMAELKTSPALSWLQP